MGRRDGWVLLLALSRGNFVGRRQSRWRKLKGGGLLKLLILLIFRPNPPTLATLATLAGGQVRNRLPSPGRRPIAAPVARLASMALVGSSGSRSELDGIARRASVRCLPPAGHDGMRWTCGVRRDLSGNGRFAEIRQIHPSGCNYLPQILAEFPQNSSHIAGRQRTAAAARFSPAGKNAHD